MPEQITKYPDVTLQVLKGAGALCGEGAPQNILKQCPADRFCALPSGEMCIYGIRDIPKMTQIKPDELAAVVAPQARKCVSALDDLSPFARITYQESGTSPPDVSAFPVSTEEAIILGAVFVAGLGIGRFWRRMRNGAY
jgi:hypothetical protein